MFRFIPRIILPIVAGAVTVVPGAVAAGRPASAGISNAPFAEQQAKSIVSRDDHLAVIVNRSNPLDDLSLKELRSIAMIQRTHWPNERKITVALHEPGPAERQAVLQLVYRMNETMFTRYFLQATFTGQIPNGPRLLSSSELVRRFVVNVPGAVGFVRLADVDASVKTVRVDGHPPGATDYPLIPGSGLQP